jgi:hypothetical protein
MAPWVRTREAEDPLISMEVGSGLVAGAQDIHDQFEKSRYNRFE